MMENVFDAVLPPAPDQLNDEVPPQLICYPGSWQPGQLLWSPMPKVRPVKILGFFGQKPKMFWFSTEY